MINKPICLRTRFKETNNSFYRHWNKKFSHFVKNYMSSLHYWRQLQISPWSKPTGEVSYVAENEIEIKRIKKTLLQSAASRIASISDVNKILFSVSTQYYCSNYVQSTNNCIQLYAFQASLQRIRWTHLIAHIDIMKKDVKCLSCRRLQSKSVTRNPKMSYPKSLGGQITIQE